MFSRSARLNFSSAPVRRSHNYLALIRKYALRKEQRSTKGQNLIRKLSNKRKHTVSRYRTRRYTFRPINPQTRNGERRVSSKLLKYQIHVLCTQTRAHRHAYNRASGLGKRAIKIMRGSGHLCYVTIPRQSSSGQFNVLSRQGGWLSRRSAGCAAI